MPRANRYHIPGQVWHITHRCHNRQWLLKYSKDRQRWIHWLFKARQRFGLCVLNYMVTSNHIHLLVQDAGKKEIASSMQLIAARTAQEFNRRKKRQGAFWEDRYHATAVQTNGHLSACMTYIDLNMVRAGAVEYAQDWPHCGLSELLHPPVRKARLNLDALQRLLELDGHEALVSQRLECLRERRQSGDIAREGKWSESVMVGDQDYLVATLHSLKTQYPGLEVVYEQDGFRLGEPPECYFA